MSHSTPAIAFLGRPGWKIQGHEPTTDYRQARNTLMSLHGLLFPQACAALDAAHLHYLNAHLDPQLRVGVDEEFGGFMYECRGGECKRSGGHDSPGGAALSAQGHLADPAASGHTPQEA